MASRRRLIWSAGVWVGIAALALGLLIQIQGQPTAASGVLRVRFLDIGQGDAILVDTPSQDHLLVDGGPDDGVVPLLMSFLIPPQHLDLVVATHNDADHIGGLPAALARFPVDEVWITGTIWPTQTYERWVQAMESSGARIERVSAGTVRMLGQTEVRVLSPLAPLPSEEPVNSNDTSIVLKLTYGATSVLLTGDLEFAGELALIEANPAQLGTTVLKVGHHGSAGSTSQRFLDYVQPEIAVISVGRDNRYDHPRPETLERLATSGTEVHRTDHEGTVTILSDGLTAQVQP